MPRYSNDLLFNRMVQIHNVDYMSFDEVYNLQWMYIYQYIYKIPADDCHTFHETYHIFRESLRIIREMKKKKLF